MDEIRYIRYDEDFAKKIPTNLLAELITFDGVIPDRLSSVIRRNNLIYRHERGSFINIHPYIRTAMYAARAELDQYNNVTDKINHKNNIIIQFILDNPQFKPLIDYIEFNEYDENGERTIIKKVPIDQYLEEYVN